MVDLRTSVRPFRRDENHLRKRHKKAIDAPVLVIYYPLNTGKEVILNI